MLRALRNRSIALLWLGQALSAVGDEIYRVALIWLAVGLIGADTGYLAAGQSAALLGMSFVAGRWADRWDHFKTLIGVDLARAFVVMTPVIVSRFVPVTLPWLCGMALVLSALGAFFDPALQAMLPRFSRDASMLKAATGLMSTTIRMARITGPAVIGALTTFLPTIHFFTLDSLTFALSALSISMLTRHTRHRFASKPSSGRVGFWESITSGFRLTEKDPILRSIFFARATASGAWSLAFGLGLALLVHQIVPHDVRAFGAVIASYGCGNLASALILGNAERKRPTRLLFTGYVWLGAGFLLTSVAPTLGWLMAAAAFGGFGGPMNDIPFIDLVQARFAIEEIPKTFRLRMALDTTATLLCLLASPFLFRELAVPTVIAICGAISVVVGLWGLLNVSPRVVSEQLPG